MRSLFDLDKWQEIFSSLTKHKLRTGLTALGVIWGIFMLIVMMGAGTALENGSMHEFGKWSVKSLFVWTERTTVPYHGLQAGRFVPLYMDDIKAVENRIQGIDLISPRLWLDVDKIIRENKEGAFSVRGGTEALVKIEPVSVSRGRFINQRDLEERRKVIVIGHRVSEVLFGETEPIGEYLKIRGVWFRIIGVAKSDRSGDDSREDNESIFMPITTMQYTYNMINQVGWFVCTVKEGYPTAEVQENLKTLLRERHDVSPEDKQAIGSFNLEEEFLRFQNLFFWIRSIVLFVSLGTLAAGVIGVGNIMLIIVKERVKEIGVRKALGATNGSIVRMILVESVALTTLSGYIGLMAGIGVLSLADKVITSSSESGGTMFLRDPEVNLTFALIALVCLVISGAIAGAIPAYQAASVNPAQTLKEE